MIKKTNYAIWILVGVLIILVFGLLSSFGVFDKIRLNPTGSAQVQDAETYADVQAYFSINMSLNLSARGVEFYIVALPTTNGNAVANTDSSDQTVLYLTVGAESNVPVQFCIRANDTLRSGVSTIAAANYVWANSSTNDINNPALDNATELLLAPSWGDSIDGVTAANSVYYRFWLSVPGAQAPGDYRNQVNFKGIQTGGSC